MDEQIGVYQDMLAHQTRLRDRAEERRRKVREALVTMASIGLPEWLNDQIREGIELEQIADDVIIEKVVSRLKGLVLLEQTASAENSHNYRAQRDQAVQANKILEQRLARLRAELQEAQNVIEQQKAALREKELELRAKEQELVKLRKPSLSPLPKPNDEQEQKALPNDPEAALQTWQQDRAYERQAFILIALAETDGGLVFQQDIIRHCQQNANWGVSDQVISRHIRELASYKLVAIKQEGGMTTVSGGRPPNKVELTNLGKAVYYLLTGREAIGVNIEKMDQAHVTPQHRDLILWAAHLLESNGYEIESLTPSPILLEGGRQCKPDLLVFDGESRVLVEVETDAGKSERRSKWLNLWEASEGEIYVICESKSGQARIIAEVNDALGDRKANFHFSNREEIELGARNESHGIWLKVRFRK